MNNRKALKINSNDNVAVAVENIQKGETVLGAKLNSDINAGHKFALNEIEINADIIKYGLPIGHATSFIQKGSHVHTHNMKTNLKGVLDYEYEPYVINPKPEKQAFFEGYVRDNGLVGIRNEIWIVPTVGCVNKTAEIIEKEANARFGDLFDGVYAFTHPHGCSQLAQDHMNTQKILAGLVKHPNAAGILVLGLGCENNNIPEFKKVLGDYDPDRVKFLNVQDVENEIETAIELLDEIAEYAKDFKREKVSADKLIIGMKCGGSDGFSGITANPLVGRVCDEFITCGGTAILTEVPEMFGAETILLNRAQDREVFDKTVKLINNFKEYFMRYNQEIYENPSPGNKAGGISTLEDKSLGCTQKSGSSCVTDVLEYGEVSSKKGLNLLSAPGNDIVAETALTAAGAHMILFTTGRGTPLGAPVPTVKISTNTELYNKKPHWIDFDAGILTKSDENEVTQQFFEYLLKVASGYEKAKNEINNYREIAIFKDGVTL